MRSYGLLMINSLGDTMMSRNIKVREEVIFRSNYLYVTLVFEDGTLCYASLNYLDPSRLGSDEEEVITLSISDLCVARDDLEDYLINGVLDLIEGVLRYSSFNEVSIRVYIREFHYGSLK